MRYRIKKQIPKNGYLKYLKRKHDYTKCNWCNRVIMKKDNYCCKCGNPNQEKVIF
nr:MAG TPA_asm: Rubredoxin-like zinc ribbon domain protein [Bacteriophage sp.]